MDAKTSVMTPPEKIACSHSDYPYRSIDLFIHPPRPPYLFRFASCVSLHLWIYLGCFYLPYQFLFSLIYLSCIDHCLSIFFYHWHIDYPSIIVCPSLSMCRHLSVIFLSLTTVSVIVCLSAWLAVCLSIGLSVWRSIYPHFLSLSLSLSL